MNPQAITAPRARQSDPSTSHAAAARSVTFADSHAARILLVLQYGDGMNAHEIGDAAGLTVVQVDRRTIELQRQGKIRLKKVGGWVVVRNGMRVWEAV